MKKEFEKDEQIAGERVYYNDDCKKAVYYLDHDLQRDESKVFFIAARKRGRAEFEDDDDRQFTLRYKNGDFFLEHR